MSLPEIIRNKGMGGPTGVPRHFTDLQRRIENKIVSIGGSGRRTHVTGGASGGGSNLDLYDCGDRCWVAIYSSPGAMVERH